MANSDIVLPANAKYIGFVDNKLGFNPHWDITWSFTYALVGTQHAFCTFLTPNQYIDQGIPGQYLGYLGLTDTLYTESLSQIYTDSNTSVPSDGIEIDYGYNGGVLGIAFDSTGLFAIETDNNPGLLISDIKKNSLIIRGAGDQVMYNIPLNPLSAIFTIAHNPKKYQTLRFRLTNSGTKLYIDVKTDTTEYVNLTTVGITMNPDLYPSLYPGLTFCSPISSYTIQPSTLYVKNFHVQGNTDMPSYESTVMIPLTSSIKTLYTTISGITANPI